MTTVRTGYDVLNSTTNQCDTIGVANASDDVSPHILQKG